MVVVGTAYADDHGLCRLLKYPVLRACSADGEVPMTAVDTAYADG
jgi:hypothetical protein